jgi:anaerobic magnesium-protoporphyrin IX monomethyl ester cyclase
MKKVILLSPPSRIMNHYRPPLALMYLSGYLRHNGIDAEIIDIIEKHQIRDRLFYANKGYYLKDIEDRIVRQAVASDADIVGITCYTPELQEVQRVCRSIKAQKPDVKVIAGGIHPTLYPADFLKPDSVFDYVVIGEGEVTLNELVNALRLKACDMAGIKGIGFYDHKKQTAVITPKRELAAGLDDIAYPDYAGIDMDFYTTPSPYAIRGVFTRSFYISSSRGCPSSCTFCVSKKMREFAGIERFVRLRSPGSLFAEIEFLRDKYGIDSFYFIDDLFTLKKENVFAFCDLMRAKKLPMIWGCSSKVNTVTFDMLRSMKSSGCVQIDFGVERGSNESLSQLKKGITLGQIREAFTNCHKLGIRCFANLLVNAPGETEKDLEDIIGLVEQIKPTVSSFNIFTPYPGCEIYESVADKLGPDFYPLLMEPADSLIEKFPAIFRFASHTVAFDAWVASAMRKYNRLLPNLSVYVSMPYLRSFLYSRYKSRYFSQMRDLARELVAQKF